MYCIYSIFIEDVLKKVLIKQNVWLLMIQLVVAQDCAKTKDHPACLLKSQKAPYTATNQVKAGLV